MRTISSHGLCRVWLQTDEVLASAAVTIIKIAVHLHGWYDITKVPDFNDMYELYDPSTVMFFFRNKHIMIDLGTRKKNRINWALTRVHWDCWEHLLEESMGPVLVISPIDYSTKDRWCWFSIYTWNNLGLRATIFLMWLDIGLYFFCVGHCVDVSLTF